MHQRLGTTARMEAIGARVIRDYMPDQHRTFYAQLPFMALGVVDAEGWPWASLLEGEPGFASSPEPRTLHVSALPGLGDPARTALTSGAAVGLLGIELHTRRRNRVNGQLMAHGGAGFTLQVGHSFGNCPQYIQLRQYRFERSPAQPYRGATEALPGLDDAARATIAQADTFFVASYYPGDADRPRQVDISHRGGKPGFVRIDGDMLTIPDFAGNLHFNTLGNLLAEPRAGLLFVDFDSGDTLQLVGRTEVILEGEEIAAFQGTERLWRLKVERVVRRPGALALRWALQGYSSNALMTGSWPEAQARIATAALGRRWRPFRVTRIEQESSAVRSFYLAPADGLAALPQQAGQHLPVRLTLPGDKQPSQRSYTLSNAASDGEYRLSIKREGRFSSYLHDSVEVGSILEAGAPQGQFGIDSQTKRPAVLLAGGIGITPLLAMLRHLVFEGRRKRGMRSTYLVYATRTVAERAFDVELQALLEQAGDALQLVRVVSQPEPGREAGRDFDVQGHIDTALLKSLLPWGDHDFYLCGPAPFMQALYDGLRDQRIGDDRIHAENFGPAGLKRRRDAGLAAAAPAPATTEVKVIFAESGKEARWSPASGNLLQLAEARGLAPPYGCRGGSCGSCSVKLLAGEVSYPEPTSFQAPPGEALLCCAVPAQGAERSGLQLAV
jgi:ferredoxin-NADP reductase/predicted pyridoxine 5'-phosphate oxidase superfamily flavin-nucleotide-binding protein